MTQPTAAVRFDFSIQNFLGRPEIGDQLGAHFGAFHGPHPPACDIVDGAAFGTFCWNDLMSPDMPASAGFYRRLFGWSTREIDLGDAGIWEPWYAASMEGDDLTVAWQADVGVSVEEER